MHLRAMTQSYVRHDSFICGTCLIYMWDVTHTYVGRDSYICETWLYPWDSQQHDLANSHVRHVTVICTSWHSHTRELDSFICGTWHVYVWVTCVSWLIHIWHATHVRVSSAVSHLCALSQIYICIYRYICLYTWTHKCMYIYIPWESAARSCLWPRGHRLCCSVLQCVAVCCSVLQCVAVCCSVLQCVAEWCSVLQCVAVCCCVLLCIAV